MHNRLYTGNMTGSSFRISRICFQTKEKQQNPETLCTTPFLELGAKEWDPREGTRNAWLGFPQPPPLSERQAQGVTALKTHHPKPTMLSTKQGAKTNQTSQVGKGPWGDFPQTRQKKFPPS